MRYKLFGRSGLRVSELCLGTMTFGTGQMIGGGIGEDRDTCKAIFDAFANAGGNFIDTANTYTQGISEELVGEFIGADRDHFIVGTKYSLSTANDIAKSGNNKKNMVRSLDDSLRRLNTDYVDIYWLHSWDSMTCLDEIMRGLNDLVSSGKILYIAISNTPAWEISRANMLADLRGWSPFVGIQIEYSLVERAADRDLLPMAKELDLGVTAYAPLGGGFLTGKYLHAQDNSQGRLQSFQFPERYHVVAQLIVDLAREHGCTPSQIALSALRAKNQLGSVIPIIGARTASQIKDNLGCLNVALNESQLQRINEATAIDLGFPHNALAHEMSRSLVTGGKFDSLDNHRRS